MSEEKPILHATFPGGCVLTATHCKLVVAVERPPYNAVDFSQPCPSCTTHPEHLAQKLLDMIAEATAEMERVSEQLALDMQSDLVDEIEQVCKQHVEKVQ